MFAHFLCTRGICTRETQTRARVCSWREGDAEAAYSSVRGPPSADEEFGFVGKGSGSWEQQVVTTYSDWRLRPACKFALGAAVLLGLGMLACLSATNDAMAARLRSELPWPAEDGARSSGLRRDDMDPKTFDCDDGALEWRSTWHPEKMRWCCRHVGLGCIEHPAFACEASDMRSWPSAEAKWCCDERGIGCDEAAMAGCSEANVGACLGAGPRARPTDKQATTPATTTPKPEPLDHDHDCSYELSHWMKEWTPQKKAWCCQREHIGCPPMPAG
mmetsp:Transcript_108557/g.313548  ORF Transcript_108557/g.313548 Transcript_108557/m.313548 type:complete len:274 (+) Transcript_108557:78-899(+)